MPKGLFGMLGTGATKAVVYTAAGSVATIGVQHYYSGSSAPQTDRKVIEERDDRKKKLEIEVNQLSDRLEKEKQELKLQQQALEKSWAALREERSAVERMREATPAVVVQESVGAVVPAEEPEPTESPDVKVPESKAVVPTETVPQRPAVFDGGGKATDKTDKPRVIVGSSGDVVTVEKGGSGVPSDDEDLRGREKELWERERRLLDREMRLREGKENLRRLKRKLRAKLGLPDAANASEDGEDFADDEFALLDRLNRGSFDPTGKAVADGGSPYVGGRASREPSREDTGLDVSKMDGAALKMYSAEETTALAGGIAERANVFETLVPAEKVSDGKGGLREMTAKERQDQVKEFARNLGNTMKDLSRDQSDEIARTSLEGAFEGLDEEARKRVKKNLDALTKVLPDLRGAKTLSSVNTAASALRAVAGKSEKAITAGKYADFILECAVKDADGIKKSVSTGVPSESDKKFDALFGEFLKSKDRSDKAVVKVLRSKPAGGLVDPDKAVADCKKDSEAGVKGLYEKEGGLLIGFRELAADWEKVKDSKKAVERALVGVALPPPPPPPPLTPNPCQRFADDKDYVDILGALDPDFKAKNLENEKEHDDAVTVYRKAAEKAKEAKEAYDKAVEDKKGVDERRRLLNDKKNADAAQGDALKVVVEALEKWKKFRKDAAADPEKKLLVAHKRWLEGDLSGIDSVDAFVRGIRKKLDEEKSRPSAAVLQRRRKMGIADPVGSGTVLTDEQRSVFKKFVDAADKAKGKSSELKLKLWSAKEIEKSAKSLSFLKDDSSGQYDVVIPDGALFGAKCVFDCLRSLAPSIRNLTIGKLDASSVGRPFASFMELCPSFTALKKLRITGLFAPKTGAEVREKRKTQSFFDRYYDDAVAREVRHGALAEGKTGLPIAPRELFFRAVSLIPNLKTFEMYSIDETGKPNDEDVYLQVDYNLWAAVMPLESVRLPSCSGSCYVGLFMGLMRKSGPFKTMNLCTAGFGDLMRTSGFPEALWQILSSGKVRVNWFGKLDFGKRVPLIVHTVANRNSESLMACLSGVKKEGCAEDVVNKLKGRKIDGKDLAAWMSGDFNNDFVNRPEVYLGLCGVCSKSLEEKLVEYNTEVLNPVLVAAKALSNFKGGKKVAEKKKVAKVSLNDPLAKILKKYPVIEKGMVVFDGNLVQVDGSVLKKITIPGLLGLVLRERINGRNVVTLAVEDGEREMETVVEKNGVKRKVPGKYIGCCWWEFPSYTSDLWKDKPFAIIVESSAWARLNSDGKDKLIQRVMTESDDVGRFLAHLPRESVSFKTDDPLFLKDFLVKLCNGKTPLYWNYLVSCLKTGAVRVSTAASEDDRKLFDILVKVVMAQPIHERLYKVAEKLKKVEPLLSGMEEKLDELKAAADAEPSDVEAREAFSKKEKEVKDLEKELGNLKAKAEVCTTYLESVRVFLEGNLSYVYDVCDKLRAEAARSELVSRWLKGDRTIRYEDVAHPGTLFDKPAENTWKVKMPAFAGIDGSDAATVNVDKVAKLVKDGILPVQEKDGWLCVVLTAEAVPVKGGAPGGAPGGSGVPGGRKKTKMTLMMDALEWKTGGKEVKLRNASSGIVGIGTIPGGVVKVKTSDPGLASINGLEATDPKLLEEIEHLIADGSLAVEEEGKGKKKRVFVTLDVESQQLPPVIADPAVGQWLSDGKLVKYRDVAVPGVLFDKPPANTFSVKMNSPKFASINGQDAAKVSAGAIQTLVLSGALKPERDKTIKKYVAVLEVEKK